MLSNIDQYPLSEPYNIELRQETGEVFHLTPAEITHSFKSFFVDLPNNEQSKIYKFSTNDQTVSFYYIVHVGIGAVIAPPNGIKIDDALKKQGISSAIQAYLKSVAQKYNFRLMALVTLESADAFNKRVLKILSAIGYHIGTPSKIAELHYCIHDSTYDGNGIPELGLGGDDFLPPTKNLI